MKRLSLFIMLLVALASLNVASAQQSAKGAKLGSFDTNNFSMQLPVKGNEWKRELRHNPFDRNQRMLLAKEGKRNAPRQNNKKIGPANSFGTLYAPNGMEWIYTANYDFDDNGMYTAAHLTIYNEKQEVIATINDTFELAEHQTGVNSVAINPYITQKFFNVNDKYEIILFIHATTDDYMGCVYQHIFTLGMNQTEPLMTIPGNEIIIADMATDQWSEKKQMVMMREEFTEDDQYLVHYDVYDHAGWGSLNAPVLLHTFTFDYQYLAGSGGNAYPITLQKIGGKAHYALAYYEKPYFDQSIPVYEEPVVTPDNCFIIDLYSEDDFETPYKTIRIPMEVKEGYLYSFPGIGAFLGNDDFSVGLFGSETEPYFIVSYDNYLTASDDFETDIYLYDLNGNQVKTIATAVGDYMQMTDVPGADKQFCFIDLNAESISFVDLPSCDLAAELPFAVDGRALSTTLDRVPMGNSYNIVISSSQGEVDKDDNIHHPIAYFNADGSLNHWDLVNLGKDVVMAQPAIISDWLNPYLFDTDNDADYMFLVKLPANNGTTQTHERLWIVNPQGDIQADFGPTDEGNLNSIAVLNANTDKATLSISYYDWQTSSFVLSYNDLPLSRFTAGGKGTAEEPYLISTPGDLMLIAHEPNAHYQLTGDIDCKHYPFTGNKCEFAGTLDGQGHSVNNLSIVGCGLISELVGSAVVKNLNIEAPVIYPEGSFAGVLAATARYDGNNTPTISNVNILKPSVDDDEYNGSFGGIIGQLTTGAVVEASSVTDADFNLPQAIAGGLVGEVNPTGAYINAVYFTGSLNADVAGGVIGEVTNVTLQDAHVNADIIGARVVGGIIGNVGETNNNRGLFSNCYVEGTLTSLNEKDASVGGIAGAVEAGENECITNNVVALESISFEAGAKASAHRVIGHSCADEPGEILWDDPWWDTFEDPYQHQDLWPRAAVAPDKGFKNNYAVYPLAPVNGDATMAADDTSVEGKTVAEADYENWQSFFTECGFRFGENTNAPWVWSDGKPALWFESGIQPSAIKTTYGKADYTRLTLANGILKANGAINVYTTAGVKVASAANTLSISQLKPGMYIAKSGKQSVKFTVK